MNNILLSARRQVLLLGSMFLLFSFFSCTSGSFKREQIHIAIWGNDISFFSGEGGILSDALSKFPALTEANIDTLFDEKELIESRLRSFSTLIVWEHPNFSLSPKAQNEIQRYLEGGGGMILMKKQDPPSLSWSWYDKWLRSSADSTQVTLVNNSASVSTGFHAYQTGRIAVIKLPGPDSGAPKEAFNSNFEKALNYTVGENRYYHNRITTLSRPSEDRFHKVVLDDQDVNEPMELTFLDKGKVLYIERRGKMKVYDPGTQATRTIVHFKEVCTEGNYEDGLLGVEADPNFEDNRFIYLYYSPPCEIKEQYLSRFYLDANDSLHRESEKVILKVPVQRETCCHSGGSIAFGPDGNLFLSTGDNTSSKESDGFSPLDERPGRAPFDAQKSSGNTHDLRGKILRIKVESDGSYSIPEGNLFPSDGSQGRPEIYVMGARNPFRISIDAKTRYVYWGDVGPDGTRDGKYGPQSFDEFNQAQKAGNFGWPYFVGDNFAYRFRDFAEDTVGAFFDPEAPLNQSPNNTGARLLPPAQPAWIWYSKRKSKQFPYLGRGSNSAMAGPTYYEDPYNVESQVRFPAYYNGKLFLYEWARSWINVVEMDESGQIHSIEPFLPDMDLVKPIDLEFGPDGALYLLEYGQNYFLNNPEAKLSRIEYTPGNRPPVPIIEANTTQGAVPLAVQLSALSSYDWESEEGMKYQWVIGDSVYHEPQIEYLFNREGIYEVVLTVKDRDFYSESTEIQIMVGNSPPDVQIAFDGNRSFFLGQGPIPYQVHISDPEDEGNGGIDTDQVKVGWTYMEDKGMVEILKKEALVGGIAGGYRFLRGKELLENSDCLSCHAPDTVSVGPSYTEVADRYSDDPESIALLSKRISLGGNGNWGEKIMPGHPQHSLAEIEEMVRYILSLNDEIPDALLSSGVVHSSPIDIANTKGAYVLQASYQDKGAGSIPPLSSQTFLLLRSPRVEAEDFESRKGMGERAFGAHRSQAGLFPQDSEASIGLSAVDLRDIKSLSFSFLEASNVRITARLDSLDGPLIGQLRIGQRGKESLHKMTLKPINEHHTLLLMFEPLQKGKRMQFALDWVEFKGN